MTALGAALLLMFVLLAVGATLAAAMGLSAVAALWPNMGDSALNVVGTQVWQLTNSFTLSAVPLFVLMGEALQRSGLTNRLFRDLSVALAGFPGGLLQVNVVGSAAFAATSGSSVASAAALAPMLYRQEVDERGYDRRLVLGTLTAGGTLGILIPPSIIMILYGATTGTSVASLFAAGMIPGAVLGLAYAVYAALRVYLAPSLGGDANPDRHTGAERVAALARLWPFAALAVVILGSIYGGIATPTESAAVGASLAVGMGVTLGALDRSSLRAALLATARLTSMLYFIVFGANTLATVLARSGIGTRLGQASVGLGPIALFAIVVLAFLVAGMFFDAISLMLISIPIVMPIVEAAGWDPVWFGIVLVVLLEAGLLTPPVGMNLFVVQGTTGASLKDIVLGSMPFLAIQLVFLVALGLWPELALWLPRVWAT